MRGPWRRPWFLAGLTWAYIVWSLVPVLIAIQFSFNAGRSRSVWQGFSFRWYWGDPLNSVWHDPSMRLALQNSLILAVVTTIIATPIGVALALGLTRWRGHGSGASNGLMLLPLATPEIVMGSALFIVFTNLYTAIPLGRPAQILGHVTFSISYVVVIVRGRLLSIGREYEIAAQDLGASPTRALRSVLVPMLLPAIFASSMIVFAGSLDDFVVQLLPLLRRLVRDGADQAVQRGAQRAVTGLERTRDHHARGDGRRLVLRLVGAAAAVRGLGPPRAGHDRLGRPPTVSGRVRTGRGAPRAA